jgi:hypothetical protein
MNKHHEFDLGDCVVFKDMQYSEVFVVTRIRFDTSVYGVETVVYDIETLTGSMGYGGIDEYRLAISTDTTNITNNNAYDRAMRGI